jgi:glycosyltransferase involved in cell wall biosynthesis
MRNEAGYIERCLRSIFTQDYPVECLEVLVYDSFSTDSSRQIVERFVDERPNCRLFDNPKVTQSAAWNLGIAQARGDVIGIVSAHAELAPDYVRQAVETLRRTGANLVGGPTRSVSDTFVGQVVALALNTSFGVGGGKFHYTMREIESDTVFMGLCWRELYKQIGGFDEDMVRNQDDEFSYRLLEAGGSIVCNPAIQSRYFSRSTLGSLLHQYFQYGFWKVRVMQKHPRQMRFRQFTPPIFVFALLVSFFFTICIPWGYICLVLIAGSYLIANISASIVAAAQKGWKHLLLLPVCYAILHVSYGSGFLVGLIKFWNRWMDKKGKVTNFEPENEND